MPPVDPKQLAEKLFPFALAAYSPCPQEVKPLTLTLGANPNPLLTLVSKDISTWGSVIRKDNEVFISIRGTETLWEWLDDANAPQVTPWHGVGKIHAGFSQISAAIFPSIRASNIGLGTADTIYVTGHSLGAAIATIFASDLAMWFSDKKIVLCTFASPRVGNSDFAVGIESITNLTIFRIANQRDIVTHLPSRPCYSHAGNAYLFDGGFTLNLAVAHDLPNTYKAGIDKMPADSKLELIA